MEKVSTNETRIPVNILRSMSKFAKTGFAVLGFCLRFFTGMDRMIAGIWREYCE